MGALLVIPDPAGLRSQGSAVRGDDLISPDQFVVTVDGSHLPDWWKIPAGGARAGGSATYFLNNG